MSFNFAFAILLDLGVEAAATSRLMKLPFDFAEAFGESVERLRARAWMMGKLDFCGEGLLSTGLLLVTILSGY